MTQERIDIEAYIQQFTAVDEIDETEQLKSAGLAAIAELKRCYDTMDTAVSNLKELFEVTESSEVQSIANYLEGTAKPCCEDPDYAYYWHDASGCFTVIHGAAECSECGKAWKATQEGDWTIHFDRPTEDPYTG